MPPPMDQVSQQAAPADAGGTGPASEGASTPSRSGLALSSATLNAPALEEFLRQGGWSAAEARRWKLSRSEHRYLSTGLMAAVVDVEGAVPDPDPVIDTPHAPPHPDRPPVLAATPSSASAATPLADGALEPPPAATGHYRRLLQYYPEVAVPLDHYPEAAVPLDHYPEAPLELEGASGRRAAAEQAAPVADVIRAPAVVTTTLAPNICGDSVLGVWLGGNVEQCDDGNLNDGDGCSSVCTVEPGYACAPSTALRRGRTAFIGVFGGLSVCVQNQCGDADKHTAEECDDGNLAGGDGCNAECLVEDDYQCTGPDGTRSFCEPPVCGDGREATVEQCDDGNLIPGDGCDGSCRLELFLAFKCSNSCTNNCGLYQNQRRTICLPFAPVAPPADPPAELTSTLTPFLNLTPPTPTVTLTVDDREEARLLYASGVMAGVGTPCGTMLNGKNGCCQTLGELPQWDGSNRQHPYGLADLSICRWPRAGWVKVASHTCEHWGYFTVNDTWPLGGLEQCRDGAAALGLHGSTEDVQQEPAADATEVEVTGLTVKTTCVEAPPKRCWQGNTQIGQLEGVYRRRSFELYDYVGPHNSSSKLFWKHGRWNLHWRSLIGLQTNEAPWFSNTRLVGGWVNSSAADEFAWRYPVLPYPRVAAVGRPVPRGCSRSLHTDQASPHQLRYYSPSLADAAPPKAALMNFSAVCSNQHQCLCRIDPPNAQGVNVTHPAEARPGPDLDGHGADPTGITYDPRITLRCSYLLHQLYCGYPCLAEYDVTSESECRVVATCPRGSLACDIPQSLIDHRDDVARQLVEARERESGAGGAAVNVASSACFGFSCVKSAAELEVELKEAEAALIGRCRGTGRRTAVCDSWLRKVYRECRYQPVAHMNTTHLIDPPLPACQPLWWRFRTYDEFVQMQPWLRVGGSPCWSAAGILAPRAGLILLLLSVYSALGL
eukprot:TRINITY_DN2299_c2_g1_i1.p1 TRINITY_DN2299_c2_g1~~TRINITY_DN2299_c2_g1_i1.p1  ORF type:complete len:946 (+),score=262.08 TRINITY_DN2299_c2_g1_i1:279-3116(+)